MKQREQTNVLWFDELHRDDVNLVGGKSASLGELTTLKDIPVPYGFATTAHAYRHFMTATGLKPKIAQILANIKNYEDAHELQQACAQIRQLMTSATMPADLAASIKTAYETLAAKVGQKAPFVAVRSSATAEDLPDASFAGQQDTYLNVRGSAEVIAKVQACFASLYTDRATYYRHKQQFPEDQVALSAAVQMMVFSKEAGVMFSVDVTNGDDHKVVVDAIWGLGEYIVQGTVTPDDFLVDKQTMEIVSKRLTPQRIELVRLPDGGVTEKAVPAEQVKAQVLSDDQVLELARYAKEIEQHYGCYMDMEFAVDEHQVWVVQARPETFWSHHNANDRAISRQPANTNNKILTKGLAASPGVATGRVHVIADPKDIDQFQIGEILVTQMTSPDWVPAMKKAVAIITDNGGITCHAAIVSREMQIPCIVGTKSRATAATELLKTGDEITVDAKNGVVYAGRVAAVLAPEKADQPVATSGQSEYFAPTATGVMMNLGDPDLVSKYANLPADGIGLMREEFLWTTYIHEHPLYLIAQGHPGKVVDGLATGIAKVARGMAPRPVILRFSDFKSGEYRHLKGGEAYEPTESADLLGWRGASRYYDPKYLAAFKLELAAVKRVRNDYGLKNLQVMIPFVRTVGELAKVTQIMQAAGLVRSADFKVYMMAEIPANIILADQFNAYIDGYSIGSNDLTMLLLGCDRNNDTVSALFDERNLAVKRAIAHLIKVAHQAGKTVSICGQAPSEYPEFTNFLISQGIDYVSVNPDMVKATKRNVAHFEQRLLLDHVTGKGRPSETMIW
ncbi:MAG: phosphoenolpyruvate synthase [Lactobacillus sp.]